MSSYTVHTQPSCDDCYFMCDHGLQAVRCGDGHLFYITLEDFYQTDDLRLYCPFCKKRIKYPGGK